MTRFICGILLLSCVNGVPSWAQGDKTTPKTSAAAIEGVVRDSGGNPVSGALVSVEDSVSAKAYQAETNARGEFSIQLLPAGQYSVRIRKATFQDAQPVHATLKAGERKHLELAFPRPSGPNVAQSPMQLDDTTHFTVAGITDWTAAGGHGSDSNLRASENLARETRSLEAQPSPGSESVIQASKEKERALLAAVSRAPSSFGANHELGEFYLHSHQPREAVQPLQTAYEINPSDYENAYELAQAYQMAGDLGKARDLVRKILSGDNRAELHRLLGDIEEQSGEPLSAVHEYEQAARSDGTEPNYFAWGAELLLHRAVQPAIEVFEKGIHAYPRSERMLAGLGAALYASGVYAKAADQLCQASDLKPSDPTPYLFLGKMEQAAPQPLECAEEKLQRFAQMQPENAQAQYYYAFALRKRSPGSANDANSNKAAALFEKATQMDPKLGEAYLQLGILWSARGDVNKAMANYRKATDANPDLAEAHFRLGQLYRHIGQLSASRQELEKYEELDKAQAAAVEQQRRDLQQFVIVFKEPAAVTP